jgi:hypothetical protein
MVPQGMPSIVFDCTNNLPLDLKRFACADLFIVYHYDLAVLGTILAIKFKIVLIALAFIVGAAVYYKLLPGLGNKGFKCEPPILYDAKHKYNYDLGPPYGHSERSDRASDLKEQSEKLDFELMATIMRG